MITTCYYVTDILFFISFIQALDALIPSISLTGHKHNNNTCNLTLPSGSQILELFVVRQLNVIPQCCLLHTSSLMLHEYFDESVPSYGILSHTWVESEEVSY